MIGADAIVVFLLGLIIGSFLNVVIYRYNTGRKLWRQLNGRSKCLACGHKLRWFELVPLLSFLAQGGRCRACRSAISWQYPLVELATGLGFWLVWRLALPPALTFLHWVMMALLIVIFAYDWRHQIIPDGPVYTFILLAVGVAIWQGVFLSHLLAGVGLAACFWLLWWASGGRWMGFADGKLALGVGLLLGPWGGVSVIVFAFWLGALVGLALLGWSHWSRRRQSYTMKSELPFAPFIIIGLALVLFFQLNVAFFF